MPYGVRRGIKKPGEFGFADIFGLGLSSSAGILAALATDFSQKGQASALYKINEWVAAAGRSAGVGDVPMWAVATGLIGFGAISIFYFQPLTRIGAFARGFGLLAAMMTATPQDIATGIQRGSIPGLLLLQPAAFVEEASLNPDFAIGGAEAAVYDSGKVRTFAVQDVRPDARYDVRLTVNFANGAPRNFDELVRTDALRGRLHNEQTGETFNLFLSAGGTVDVENNAIVIVAGVPAKSQKARLWVRVECEGYAIEVQSAEAAIGTAVEWTIDMRPSNTPLFLQRLGKSYWF